MATTQWLMSHAKLLTKVKVLILAAILVAQSHANQIWDHSVYLNEDYLLQWTVKEPDILFEVQVKAHGYIGFGFSRDGTIYGADVFIGWIDEGHISFYVSTQVQLSKCMLLLTFFPRKHRRSKLLTHYNLSCHKKLQSKQLETNDTKCILLCVLTTCTNEGL